MKRRWLSILTALALCLGLLPGTAWAEGVEVKTDGTTFEAGKMYVPDDTRLVKVWEEGNGEELGNDYLEYDGTTLTVHGQMSLANLYVTGNGNTVANHTLWSHVGIMAYMTVGHHETVAANLGASLRIYAAIDDYMFTNHGVIAYGAIRRVAFPTEILRVGPDNRALVYLDIAPERSTMYNRCVWHDFTAVTNHGIGINICEGVYRHIFAKLGLGVDIS